MGHGHQASFLILKVSFAYLIYKLISFVVYLPPENQQNKIKGNN